MSVTRAATGDVRLKRGRRLGAGCAATSFPADVARAGFCFVCARLAAAIFAYRRFGIARYRCLRGYSSTGPDNSGLLTAFYGQDATGVTQLAAAHWRLGAQPSRRFPLQHI
jgi:hypothetical protein